MRFPSNKSTLSGGPRSPPLFTTQLTASLYFKNKCMFLSSERKKFLTICFKLQLLRWRGSPPYILLVIWAILTINVIMSLVLIWRIFNCYTQSLLLYAFSLCGAKQRWSWRCLSRTRTRTMPWGMLFWRNKKINSPFHKAAGWGMETLLNIWRVFHCGYT